MTIKVEIKQNSKLLIYIPTIVARRIARKKKKWLNQRRNADLLRVKAVTRILTMIKSWLFFCMC